MTTIVPAPCTETPPQPSPPAARLNAAMPALVLVGIAGLVAEQGFYEPVVGLLLCRLAQAMPVAAWAAARVMRLLAEHDRIAHVRRQWFDLGLLAAALLTMLVGGLSGMLLILRAGVLYLALLQAARIAKTVVKRAERLAGQSWSRWRPIALLAGVFLGLSIIGGLLLWLPAATTADHRNAPWTHLLNSFFAATSACTLTGLSVYDVGREYTLFGQIVLLGLVQLGGLAALIFGTLLAVTLFSRLEPREMIMPQVGLGRADPDRLHRIVLWIVAITLSLELAGTVLLWPLFAGAPVASDRWLSPVFLAVSAFCNAGLALRGDSLVSLAGAWQVYAVVLPLILLGSLGVPVLYEMGTRLRHPARRFSLHTRLVLATTGLLLAIGSTGLFALETPTQLGGFWYAGRSHLLGGEAGAEVPSQWMRAHDAPRRLLDALFQAASAQSAGLATVPVERGTVSPGSVLLLAGLAFVGGSPASTAGGIKTVALAVLALAAWSALRRRDRVQAGGHLLPPGLVRRTVALVMVSAVWVLLVMLVLAHTQRADFLAVAVETVSAASTTGYSLGLTPGLTLAGKLLIILTMLVGRIGPLILVLIMAGPDARPTAVSAEQVLETPTESAALG